ncbi:MAG TPA: AAA domain-containing protein [Desulfosporosinus sp.]|nr:AAA domain-containing protein [Desulfosporosinus sp.]
MNLHKAFVENSPQMRVQLDTFNKMIRGMLDKGRDAEIFRDTIPELYACGAGYLNYFCIGWQLIKNIGKEEFGLVLIDEAGQAFPQSALGAIWRAKKVIAVGDPLQIEPVVTIHDTTNDGDKR